MTVKLSPCFGAGAQVFDDSGVPLAGGKIFTYLAGTTTNSTTYTTVSGLIAHANPIILDAAGRVPTGEIWLTDGITYKFVLKDSADNLIGTYDNLTGINLTQIPTAAQIPFTGFKNQSGYVQNLANNDGSDWIGFKQGGTNSVAISAQDKMRQFVSVLDFGAIGDGITDDYQAWNNAVTYCSTNGLQLYAPPPTAYYKINSNLTINCAFTAGVYRIFGGTGIISFNSQYVEFGYPEWWGAITNNGDLTVATANLAAINAAIVALPTVKFQRADYFVSNTIQVSVNHVKLQGHSVRYYGNNSCTRLIVKSGTADTMFIGLNSFPPGGINDFAQEIYVSNIELTRSETIVPPAPTNELNSCSGIRLKYCLFVYMDNVKTSEHSIGFIYDGVVQVHQRNCQSFRSLPGTTTYNDIFWGWFINGRASIGLAGGNGSIYFTDCLANVAGNPPLFRSTGFLADGGYADTFLHRFETANMDEGIYLQGLILSPDPTLKKTGNVDFHIISPIIDSFKKNGLVLYAGSDYANITVIDGYYAPASAASTGSCIEVRDNGGTLNLQGNQCICWHVPGTKGIYVLNSNGVMSDGNMILGSTNPIVLDTAKHCRMTDIICNPGESGNAAVSLTNSSRNYIAPVVCSSNVSLPIGVTTFAQGVNLVSTANQYNEINCTGIDPVIINTGSGNKLVYNGSQITSAGTFGVNNLASGILG